MQVISFVIQFQEDQMEVKGIFDRLLSPETVRVLPTTVLDDLNSLKGYFENFVRLLHEGGILQPPCTETQTSIPSPLNPNASPPIPIFVPSPPITTSIPPPSTTISETELPPLEVTSIPAQKTSTDTTTRNVSILSETQQQGMKVADDSPIAGRVVRKNKIKANEMFNKGLCKKGKLVPRNVSTAGNTQRRRFVPLTEDDHNEDELERKRKSEEAMEKVISILQNTGVDGDGKEVETPARGYVPLDQTQQTKHPKKKRTQNKKPAADKLDDDYVVKPKKITNPYILYVKQLGMTTPSPLPVFDDAAIKRLNEVCSLLEPG